MKFGTPGIYSITVGGSNASGSNVMTQTIQIADCTPTANFSLPNTSMCRVKDTVTTINSSSTGTLPVISQVWSILPSSNNTLITAANSGTLTNKTLVFTGTVTAQTIYTLTLKLTNASGTSSASQTVSVGTDCVGIFENTLLAINLQVYPNPAHDQVSVTLPSNSDTYRIKVFNILGSLVYDEETVKNSKEKVTINLANRPKGVYFLKVESGNETATRKIVLE